MAAREDIEALIERYEIPFLVHFTRAENIPSIMQHGLIPRNDLAPTGLVCNVNDELRLDGRTDTISLSIGFPNSRMLWSLRQKHPGVRWTVLAIAKSVLWENNCAFCKHNAADNRISNAQIEDLRQPAALEGMYGAIPGRSRIEQHLKTFDPTDVQAEVLAYGTIGPNRIFGAVFQRPSVLEEYKALLPGRKLVTHWDRGFFSDRAYNRSSSS